MARMVRWLQSTPFISDIFCGEYYRYHGFAILSPKITKKVPKNIKNCQNDQMPLVTIQLFGIYCKYTKGSKFEMPSGN